MSLKAFHFIFIIAAALLSAYFAGWSYNQYEETAENGFLAVVAASVVSAVGLVGYLIWFLKKSRNIGFLSLVFLLGTTLSQGAWACPTCMSNPDHPMARAAREGVWVLVMVITGVLILLASLFTFWGIRAKRLHSNLV